jgi:hypothetical protein
MSHQYTLAQVKDLITSMCDPLHFMANHIKIDGEAMMVSEERKEWAYSACNWTVAEVGTERQSGRTSFISAFVLWYAMFHEHKTVMYVVPNIRMTKVARQKIQEMYDSLPEWMRPKLKENNAHCMAFENGARILFNTASENTGRGYTINMLVFDEWDLIREQVKDTLFHNLVPCLINSQVLTTGDGTEWGVFNKPLTVPLSKVVE